MIKKLLLTAALLAPGLAHGDVSAPYPGGQSQPVVPASAVPAPAQAAGFTTPVIQSDFTQSKYANQSNWLNCNPTGPFSIPNPEWHNAWVGFGTQIVAPCSAYTQQTDPVLGGPALQMHWDNSYCQGHCVGGNGWAATLTLESVNSDSNGTQIPPYAYYEVVFRWDTPLTNTNRGIDIWSNTFTLTEFDTIEAYGKTIDGNTITNSTTHSQTGSSGTNWSSPYQPCHSPPIPTCSEGSDLEGHGYAYTCNTCKGDFFPNGLDVTQYHKWAWRVTSNGTTDTFYCVYIDDITIGCSTVHPDATELADGTWSFILLNAQNWAAGSDNFNLWVKSIAVWSCAAGNSGQKCLTSSPNP
jgi:hypothetical protein